MPVRRIFVAIDVDEDVRRQVGAYIARMKALFPNAPVRWEPLEKLHLTMRFIGNTDDQGLADATGLVETTASVVRSFTIRIRNTGAFEKREGSVLWVGVGLVNSFTEEDPIQRIASLLNPNNLSKRRFKPHLTIARVKNVKTAAGLINAHRSETLDAGEFEVRALAIYESKLLPTGSVYSLVSKHWLI